VLHATDIGVARPIQSLSPVTLQRTGTRRYHVRGDRNNSFLEAWSPLLLRSSSVKAVHLDSIGTSSSLELLRADAELLMLLPRRAMEVSWSQEENVARGRCNVEWGFTV